MATHHGHNEGGIYQTATGTFRGSMSVPTTGKRKYFSGKNRKEVRQQIDRFKANLTLELRPPTCARPSASS